MNTHALGIGKEPPRVVRVDVSLRLTIIDPIPYDFNDELSLAEDSPNHERLIEERASA